MPPIAGLTYRRGMPGDELCISVLALQVFLDTYATNGIRPDLAREALDVYSTKVFAARLQDPAVQVIVAENDGYVVGFADLSFRSACPQPDITGVEVLRLYVQAPFQRRGIGRALLKIAEQVAVERGDLHIWLTTWIGNAGAVAFYPNAGYVKVGTTQYVIEGQSYENHVFSKGLAVKAKAPVPPASAESPSALIDAKIKELGDWRGELLARLRALIKQADPEVTEAWKWRGTPVWMHNGIICTGETYKKVVKMTFAKGASLADPSRLFNSSLDGNVRRAIDFPEGAKVDEAALKALIRAAVVANESSAGGKSS